jgi:prefoldin subunit 5
MEDLLRQSVSEGSVDLILQKIQELQSHINALDDQIGIIMTALKTNEHQRNLLSKIKNVDISDYQKRNIKYSGMKQEMLMAMEERSRIDQQVNELKSQLYVLNNELETLKDANAQYQSTLTEIDKHSSMDHKYKIISEATSSTKGKPVITIREKMEEALFMANRLLDVMYDGEIELLTPIIDETHFTLPFRCGTNTSEDIRYGSQSESTLLSLAVSLSLASSMLPDFIPTVDELDAYLDGFMHEGFLLMLQEIMSTLKLEQMFLISHSIDPTMYESSVYCLNLSEEIDKLKSIENV